MSKHWKIFALVSLLAVSSFTVAGCGGKEKAKYPSKPIEYIVHAGAGGSADTFARVVTDNLTKEKLITVPFVVTNKPGGGGAVAFKYVAAKAGDPYVLLSVPSTLVTAPMVSKDCPDYKEFTPITLLATEPITIAVSADSPYKTLDDLIRIGKEKPGGLTWAMASIGSNDHLFALLFAKKAGVKIVGTPNTTETDAMVAVLGGHADAASLSPRTALGQVQAGKMRILAISTTQRLKGMPDVKTAREQGLDISLGTPRGVVAPKGIPAEDQKFLIEQYKKLQASERFKKYLDDMYLVQENIYGDDYAKFLKEQTNISRPLLQEAGLIKK